MATFRQLVQKEIEGLPQDQLFGLAISGGGIRSATFALGVLQFLASKKLLHQLHYLSTVSGGGYIGSWLSAWINRTSMAQVEAELVPPPIKPPEANEAQTIRWLRRYGKYLSPDLSLFSADTWLIFTIWGRNTLLNLLLLLLLLTAILLVPWAFLAAYQNHVKNHFDGWLAAIGYGFVFLGTLLAVFGLRNKSGWGARLGIASAGALSVGSLFQVFALGWLHSNILAPPILGAVLGLLIGASMAWRSPHKYGASFRILLSVIAAALGLTGTEWILSKIPAWVNPSNKFLIPILAPQMLTLLDSLLVVFLIGLAGRHQPDELREWWSRVGAWLCIFGLVGLGLAGIAIAGPVIMFFLRDQVGLAIATGSIWALATGAGVLLGRSPSTSGNEKSKHPITDMLLPLTPVIFVAGFLILVSTGVYRGLAGGGGIPHVSKVTECKQGCETVQITPGIREAWTNTWVQYASAVQGMNDPMWPAKGAVLSFVLFLFFSWLFDINEFSLHPFYHNRLVRAYLGASRSGKRNADSFTNLDPEDDLRILELRKTSHTGPIHLVNTAVNLNLADAGLDERHAASFVFTPYGCGYSLPFEGAEYYQEYPEDTDFRLGAPITISGAAASPNMGSHTSAPVAFLLTLFNVRLGFWMNNTARLLWTPKGPRIGTRYYLAELFARADRHSKYVYLSDGGHFENLAVYELLRRRCRYILCIDAEEDAGMKFEGLGELIRKARADLGVEISINVSNIEERNESGFSQRHCAVADVQYPEAPDARATLLYLKLSVTGDEPVDVLHYRKLNPAFPHQSTGDQFFSESQFESYRALGFHASETAFRPIDFTARDSTLNEIFRDLSQFWKGVPRNLEASFTRHTEEFLRLIEELRTDKDLWYLNGQFDHQWPTRDSGSAGIPAKDPEYTKGFYFCQQLIQLMENVYVDLDLEANYDHPAFAGWMEQFRRWKQSPMFQHTYDRIHETFGYLFRSFYERHLN